MKKLKKMMAIVLAVMVAATMGMAMTVTSFAATTGTITITPPSGVKADDTNTYKIYKVFDAVASDAGISYKLVSGKTDVPAGFEVDTAGNVLYTANKGKQPGDQGFVESLTDADIAAIKAYVSGDDPVKTVTATGTTAVTATGMPNGFYFITTTTGSVVTIDSAKPDASVIDKNVIPSLDKDIASVTPVNNNGGTSGHTAGADNESNQSATASVGDTVNYTVKITAQKGAENYIYHDKLSAGLTLVTSAEPVVKVGTTALEKGTHYTLTKFANEADNSKDDITITFTKTYLDTITEETDITITYSAIVNENAVIAGDGNKNTGTLDYGHDPNDTTKPGSTTPPDEPKVYAYEFQLVKDNDAKKVLTGAEFKLYADEACETEIPVIKDGDNYKIKDATSSSTAATVIQAGAPKIIGLGNGTYYLKETKAPEGYNVLTDAIPVTINNNNNDATLTSTADGQNYTSGGLEVVNKAGTEMPSTGGIGTTIFYILGAILLIGAGVVLIARRRMSANN